MQPVIQNLTANEKTVNAVIFIKKDLVLEYLRDEVVRLKETRCNMIVFASPVYYFTMTAQMEAAIQRVYCIGKPAKAKKAALLLSSGSDGVYDAAIAQFKAYMDYAGIEATKVITAHGDENKSEAKLNEVREFAGSL